MKLVQLGREVVPRIKELRHHKAVITGIKNECFVVIMKQDRSKELVRIRDIRLTDRVFHMDELKSDACEFFKAEPEPEKLNDFERFKLRLRRETAERMLQEMGHN